MREGEETGRDRSDTRRPGSSIRQGNVGEIRETGEKGVTEQRTRQRQKDTEADGSTDGGSPLQSDRGTTTISDAVVQKIVGVAAQEVEGIRMGGGGSHAVGGFLDSVAEAVPGLHGGSASQTRGVSVEVGQEETAVDLTATVAYGDSIPQLAEAVRKNVVSRVESLVGLRVTEVNVTVSDVFFPEQEHQRELEQRGQQETQEPRVR